MVIININKQLVVLILSFMLAFSVFIPTISAQTSDFSINKNSFFAGEPWRLEINSAARNKDVYICGKHTKPDNKVDDHGCTLAKSLGLPRSTNSEGAWIGTGTFPAWTIGTWQEWARIDGINSNTIAFTVSPSPTPVFALFPKNVSRGQYRDLIISNATPNSLVFVYCVDPNGIEQCNGWVAGETDSNGFLLERALVNQTITLGTWCAFARIGSLTTGHISNQDCYTIVNTTTSGGGSGGNFTLSTPSTNLTVTNGSSVSVSINAQRSGNFNDVITLALTENPSGITAAGSAIASGHNSSSLVINAAPNVALGSYNLNIRGASGSLVYNLPITLVVINSVSGSGGSGGGGGGGGGGGLNTIIRSKLLITNIEVKIDGKKTSVRTDGTISKKAKPGSTVEFRIQVKNNFTRAEDLKIQDIDVKTTIDSIDNGNDLEEDSKSFDLRPQEDKKVTAKFDIPINVDKDTFDVVIEATGQDENGTEQNQVAQIQLEVNKDSHNLKFLNFALKPAITNCQGTLNIDYKIINIGNEDEKKATLEIKNDELGLNFVQNDIAIDSGTDNNILSKSVKVNVDNLENQVYEINTNLYADNGKLTDTRTSELNVKGCVKSTGQSEVVLLEPTQKVEEGTQTVKQETPTTGILFKDVDKNTWVIALSILAFVVILVVAGIVLYVVFG